MPINCIAIDDDVNSLEGLNSYLSVLPDLQLIKCFTDPIRALTDISDLDKVDIIFMDIEMPALSGLELATMLRQKTKHLIFTTAHSKYALDAFGVNADAYLLKPYTMHHFTETINNLYPNEKSNLVLTENDFLTALRQEEPENLANIAYDNLIVMEQINEMVCFRVHNHNYISFKVNFVTMLCLLRNHTSFIQVNTNAIISKLHIKSFSGDQIVLTDGLSVHLSNKYKESFLSFLKENLLKNNFNN